MTLIYDITTPIETDMVTWPGDPPVEVRRISDLANGDFATVSLLQCGSHMGTHVDAFSHFKPGGQTIDRMDLGIYTGPACLVEIPPEISVITADVLGDLPCFQEKRWKEAAHRRILFKTRNSGQDWSRLPFQEDFVHLDPSGADFLIEQQIALIGIDYLSVEGFKTEGAPTHHRLMDRGVYILEGLYLQDIPADWYELICLPMKIKDGDGAPARAILRTLN